MDITKETNIEKLQSLAYEQLVALNITQQNIQILEARIKEVKQLEVVEDPSVLETSEK